MLNEVDFMTGRQAIELYLKKHSTFTNEQVAAAFNVSWGAVAYASRRMAYDGELVVMERRHKWAVYRRPQQGDDEQINTVFDECRASYAMRRVLCVYGAMPPAKVFSGAEGRA
ncbi:hypothetical protein G9X52_00835 [Cronobacter sakazakii]|uniref:Uncharacterized protein n=1 Tax=Cronobacter dublinensis TaxID=413497 RepID=A0A9Q4T539_9ENTR|nr:MULTISPECIES: hypothetical protein [Cronobacter]EKM0529478.1 hypothetical protein [Cronobacter turicensis]ELY3985728.1 hypothetical protein [Cronobacter muytjensii]ELY3536899.1 hypothetical protein [Cronobacter sakazakii]ELY3593827.1 hypothetical protein [Cronobacter sakazakii]ELY3605972.1 hypothetical protein [Cronobacter sakazakii]